MRRQWHRELRPHPLSPARRGRFLYAFDLIELDGADLRRDPLAVRKATLASLLARAAPGLRFNEHLDEADGPLVFAHALRCAVPYGSPMG
jgi:ATP-dependent DNA ligase